MRFISNLGFRISDFLNKVQAMAFCQVCGKTKQYGHNVSHSKRRTKRVFMPNVFGKRMYVVSSSHSSSATRSRLKAQGSRQDNGEIKRVKICAKCLKRAKRFGYIAARETAILGGMLVKVVDWQKLADAKSKVQGSRLKEKEEEKKKVEEKKEISVEELVGKKEKK